MNSREIILQRIRNELAKSEDGIAHGAAVATAGPPPAHPVWPRQKPSTATMAERFTEELKAVHGEVVRCQTMAEARQKLVAMMDQEQWSAIGAVERPLARELAAGLPAERIAWATAEWEARHMAQLAVGLVVPEFLLADTGSALIVCGTSQERLMCYLPPACVIIAKVEQLVEHLPAAWDTIGPRCGDLSLRGEFVIVTGPSRTADIEKILILGVHGPKRLVVLLVG
jgi:L-lactate dehydrogenase complex protein LldG